MLVNLLNNAVKFTDRGEVVLRVSTRWADGRPVVRFEVRDTGVGVDPSALAGLFEAFTQAKTTAHAPSAGTGLGLSISKQLVELMGGTDRGPERSRARQHVLVRRAADATRAAPRRPRRMSISPACTCWWPTTTRPTARSCAIDSRRGT